LRWGLRQQVLAMAWLQREQLQRLGPLQERQLKQGLKRPAF
jgi:hypothetical protein